MKCFKWIAFVFLIGVNISVAVYLRDYFVVAKLPLMFIALSVCCSALFVLDVKSKALRGATYGILIFIILLGFVYSLLYRRPLGFYAAASSTITFARWFILGRQSSRHNLVTKIIWVLTVILIALLFIVILYGFWLVHTTGLSNGGSCLWSKSDEDMLIEACPKQATDEETVKAAYKWVLDYLEYDEEFVPSISISISAAHSTPAWASALTTHTSSPPSAVVTVFPAISSTAIIEGTATITTLGTVPISTALGGILMSPATIK